MKGDGEIGLRSNIFVLIACCVSWPTYQKNYDFRESYINLLNYVSNTQYYRIFCSLTFDNRKLAKYKKKAGI